METGTFLDFEKPIAELEKRIRDIRDFATGESLELDREIRVLERRLEKLQKDIYSNLSRWQRVQLARHPRRPLSSDYIDLMCTDFVELHGDRCFADDRAILGGFAKIDGRKVMIIGQQKGKDTKQKLYHNFGMMNPEGYRKALRLMQLAEKFNKPVVVLIDTPGAYPGVGAEERGQAEAIARNLREMAHLQVPIIVVIIGEGASGGALGIGVGDVILMLENSWYSVISPEGCAAILWRDSEKKHLAADALKLSAFDLLELKVIDKIIPEPLGGAQKNPGEQARRVKDEIGQALDSLEPLPSRELVNRRVQKYRRLGSFHELLPGENL